LKEGAVKAKQNVPVWATAVALATVVVVILFAGYRSMNPNDPALDGHHNKIFSAADIARFRSEDTSRQSAMRGP